MQETAWHFPSRESGVWWGGVEYMVINASTTTGTLCYWNFTHFKMNWNSVPYFPFIFIYIFYSLIINNYYQKLKATFEFYQQKRVLFLGKKGNFNWLLYSYEVLF